MPKRIVISCGPIPARLDSVKFITNRFKGGLAAKTAWQLTNMEVAPNQPKYDVTVVMWKHTPLSDNIRVPAEAGRIHIIAVNDVVEYYNWFDEHAADYDAFIMAAAVANLMPSDPYDGKFPSHNYKVGERFNIEFEIAPRAIDIIKQRNPRCCLIGYKLFDGSDEELIRAAKITQSESKANIIFANTPSMAKSEKIAVFADNTILRCDFDEHLRYICDAIDATYYHTVIQPLTEEERNNMAIRRAIAIVKMYEASMPSFGTVAVPIDGTMFATTSRGHTGEPVIVREINGRTHTIVASAKATLNAATLAACLGRYTDRVVIHRHDDDPNFNRELPFTHEMETYLFPGTVEEMRALSDFHLELEDRVKLVGHGDISIRPIVPVDWQKYYDQFPEKYFSIPAPMQEFIDEYNDAHHETLEVGGNKHVCTKYAYDKYVKAENAINISVNDITNLAPNQIYLTVMKNSINYIAPSILRLIITASEHVAANTFLLPTREKVTENEAAIHYGQMIYHALRLPNDDLACHSFYYHDPSFYTSLGLTITPYGKNSALLTK